MGIDEERVAVDGDGEEGEREWGVDNECGLDRG